MVVLADVGVDGGRGPCRIVVVADRDEELRVPAAHELGDVLLPGALPTVVADHPETHTCQQPTRLEGFKTNRAWASGRAAARGFYQYAGIRGNYRAMESILEAVRRTWRYWLSRRSHKSAIPWDQFSKLLERCPLPRPKIIHNI